jgi:hypothetical protein
MLLAPCEKIAYEAGTNSASLINVFQGFTITISKNPEQTPPPDALAPVIGIAETSTPQKMPIRWMIFSLWKKNPGDEGKTFHQSFELIRPSGKTVFNQTIPPFQMTKDYHRATLGVHNFPVDEEGDYRLKVFLKEGEDGEPIQKGEDYFISVTYVDETKNE